MILNIEDNEDIQTLIRIVLRSGGHEVQTTSSAVEAFRWLDEHPRPDAILLDVQMPDVNGWDVLRALRARPDTSDVPVIMCTVKARPVDQALGWELGCDAYIQKPFDIDTILETIRDVLSRSPDERIKARYKARHELEVQT